MKQKYEASARRLLCSPVFWSFCAFIFVSLASFCITFIDPSYPHELLFGELGELAVQTGAQRIGLEVGGVDHEVGMLLHRGEYGTLAGDGARNALPLGSEGVFSIRNNKKIVYYIYFFVLFCKC